MKFLLNKKAVKEFALHVASQRYHKCTRVSQEFLDMVEASVRVTIITYVEKRPSKGVTL